jgi:hypothetical protein
VPLSEADMNCGPESLTAFIALSDCLTTMREQIRSSRVVIRNEGKLRNGDPVIVRLDAMDGMLREDDKWVRDMIDIRSRFSGFHG